MILNFTFPSSPQYTGGVVVLYEFANAMARRGHEVHFIHGPLTPHRITSLDQLSWFPWDAGVHQHLVDDLDDPTLVEGDVVFSPDAPRRLGEPAVIVQGHGLVSRQLDRSVFRTRAPKLCIASWLVGVGASYGAPRVQMLHVPLGIDHDLFRPSTPQDERRFDVAVLSNAHPAKGWSLGRAVLEEVHRRHPELSVAVFGILARDDELPPWMTFHLDLDRSELVRQVYDQAKVFLQPSWFEGFGLTAVEAMATGCALVTTDNGGSDDYALSGETALLAPPGDVDGLADAVLTLLHDDPLRRRLAAAGEELTKRFDWDRGAEILEGHLVRYLADPAALQGSPGECADPPTRQRLTRQ